MKRSLPGLFLEKVKFLVPKEEQWPYKAEEPGRENESMQLARGLHLRQPTTKSRRELDAPSSFTDFEHSVLHPWHARLRR